MHKDAGGHARRLLNNRGSGLVTVMVTMLFVSVLGVTLLFTSYTGFLIKVSERGGKESFYNASTAMDEIKIGVQEAVNDSLSRAYTQVLSEYTHLVGDGAVLQKTFAEYFKDALAAWKTSDSREYFKLDVDGNITSYDGALLLELPNIPAGAVISGNEDEDSWKVDTITAMGEDSNPITTELILRNIVVNYESPNGYASSVSTDISITMPDFYATTSTVMSSSLPSHALVAEGGLTVSSGVRTLSGGAYAGALTLRNNGSKLSFQGSTLVCGGTVSAEGDVELTLGAGTELWADNIELGASSAAMLYGKTYIKDDLTLAGSGASAELKGSYCGFGAGTDADTSSAIVINGKNTVFDMDSLDRLILAGVSFLDAPGSSIRTGESVSVKSNQLAYLVDGGCLTLTPFFDTDGDEELDAGESAGTVSGSNPYVWTGNMLLYSVADQTLWTIGGVPRKLSDYSAEVRPVLKSIVGAENYQLAYFFLNFSSQAKANEYFRDFFTYRSDRIQEYIGTYATLSDKATFLSAAGNSLYTSAGELSLEEAVPSVDVSGLAAQFANRCQTLNPNRASPGDTPFTYFVNEGAISALDDLAFKLEGSTVARVIGGSYSIPSGETAKLIIATGDVTVNYAYEGLILTGGRIIQNANISSDPDEVQNILANMENAVTDGGQYLKDYLDNTQTLGGDTGTTKTSWDLDILVSYMNWAKH